MTFPTKQDRCHMLSERENALQSADAKFTVNKVSKLDGYPIPKLDILYKKLAGRQSFTELDLSHAYEKIPVDVDYKEFLTINTHKGLYRYNRLP